MVSLDDPRWQTLAGGYRTLYDPTPALRRLASDWQDASAWEDLWGELHHQGDVGEASYAAVPVLIAQAAQVARRGWNVYALAATIESERHARRNPPLPNWLEAEYGRGWRELLRLALEDLRATDDLLVVQCALAGVALAKGATQLGTLIGHLDQSELTEFLDDAVAWSEEYADRGSPTGFRRPAG